MGQPIVSRPNRGQLSFLGASIFAFARSGSGSSDLSCAAVPLVALLLIHPGFRDSDCQRAHSRNHAHALSHRDRSARIEDVEQVRALQAKIVGGEQRKALLVDESLHRWISSFDQCSRSCSINPLHSASYKSKCFHAFSTSAASKLYTENCSSSAKPHVAVFHHASRLRIARPHDVINRIDILQERCDALESIRQFSADRKQIDAAALLEVSELRDLQAVEHDLPAHAPCAQSRSFPVVFFKLDVVMAQVDANRTQRFQVQAPAHFPAEASG